VSHPSPVVVFCLLSLLALPASAETQEAKSARQTEDTIAALTHMTDADSLAGAGSFFVGRAVRASCPRSASAS